jgi:hypothetical protein
VRPLAFLCAERDWRQRHGRSLSDAHARIAGDPLNQPSLH